MCRSSRLGGAPDHLHGTIPSKLSEQTHNVITSNGRLLVCLPIGGAQACVGRWSKIRIWQSTRGQPAHRPIILTNGASQYIRVTFLVHAPFGDSSVVALSLLLELPMWQGASIPRAPFTYCKIRRLCKIYD
jgi:hypothetical protein